MERLTEWDCDNQWYKPKKGVSPNAIHAKLGEYEDTGLEPEEIVKLRQNGEIEFVLPSEIVEEALNGAFMRQFEMTIEEVGHLAELKQQGRLIESPCKVGDVVYADKKCLYDWYCFLELNPYIRCEVIGIKKTRTQLLLNLRPLTDRSLNSRYHKFFSFSAINKTVFLTKEEAEQALTK